MSENSEKVTEHADAICAAVSEMSTQDAIDALNEVRRRLHEVSPMKQHPVDFVCWLPAEKITANDYNPNKVAPPEMDLLEISIAADGYTQPIVSMIADEDTDEREVIDGFHRNLVGRERSSVAATLHGRLPIVNIRDERTSRNDRIASTIRHNRARGKHRVDAMSDIVVELKRRNWSDKKVGRELGMDEDEVLRLSQMSGIAELFADEDFSEAWDVQGEMDDHDASEIVLED